MITPLWFFYCDHSCFMNSSKHYKKWDINFFHVSQHITKKQRKWPMSIQHFNANFFLHRAATVSTVFLPYPYLKPPGFMLKRATRQVHSIPYRNKTLSRYHTLNTVPGRILRCACVPSVTHQSVYRTCIPDRPVPGSCRRSGSPDPRRGTYAARTATARSTAPVWKWML